MLRVAEQPAPVPRTRRPEHQAPNRGRVHPRRRLWRHAVNSLLQSIAFAVCVVSTRPALAQLPPTTQGGAYTVYESITNGNRFFVAFDTATGMTLYRIPVHGTAWYRSDRQAPPIAFNPGESDVRDGDDRSAPPAMLSLTEYFPALVAHVFAHANPDEVDAQRLDDGGWEVRTMTTPSGPWAYHRDPDDPRLQNIVPATFVFDADGILRRVRSGLSETETETVIEYHDSVEHPQLAPKLVHPEHWRIIAAKTWVGDVPSEIADLDSVLAFAKTHAFAEAEAFRENLEASLATEEGERDLAQSARKMLEPINESSPKRWALPLVLVGVIFLGVGGFAWWKQR